jgi:hypothetical protein
MAAVCVGRPTNEGDGIIARVGGGVKYVTAESPPSLRSLVCVFNTVHQFIPFNGPSDSVRYFTSFTADEYGFLP